MESSLVIIAELSTLIEALYDGGLTLQQAQQLERLLTTNPVARDEYVRLTTFFVSLQMHCRSLPNDVDKMLYVPPDSDVEQLAQPNRVGISLTGFIDGAYHGTANFFSQDVPFACLMSTLIVGFALVIASLVTKEHYTQMPGRSVASAERSYAAPESERADKTRAAVKEQREEVFHFVGRITGMVDCKWAEPGRTFSSITDYSVALHDKYSLISGLMEITYDTGAKVILQGPVTYEVESANGGYMSVGKLTGKVEVEKAKGFFVRTPMAVVTDLGTEFGVEAKRNGECNVEVFAGEVVTAVVGARAMPMHLKVGDIGRIDAMRNIVVSKAAYQPVQTAHLFVRDISISRGPHQVIIGNPSFEANYLAPADSCVSASQWQNDLSDEWGTNHFGEEFFDPVPDGEQLGFLNEGEMWQELQERLAPNTNYTLSLWVGNRPNELYPDYTVELLAGEAVLISEKNPVLPDEGKFAQVKLTFTTGKEHPALGKRLKIVLRSNGSLQTNVQNHFDDVRLEVMPLECDQ